MYFVGISFDVILQCSYFVVGLPFEVFNIFLQRCCTFVTGVPFDVSYFISKFCKVFLQRFHNLGCRQMFVAAIISRLRNCKSFKIQDLYRPPSPPDTGHFFVCQETFFYLFLTPLLWFPIQWGSFLWGSLLCLLQHTWQNSNLKGSFTIFLFLVRSHILNSNGVWYSWFCPEGPINASNSKFLVFYFAPRDLDSQRHMGPWLAAQGTLTRSAGDLDSRRHRF